MKKKYILTLLALCMTMFTFGAVACNGSNNSDDAFQSESSEESSLSFTERKIEILLGEKRQLSLENLEEGETVTYTTNEANVATVTNDGVIEGTGVGSAVVKAMSNMGRSCLVQIVVYDPETYPIPFLSLNQDSVALLVGDDFAVDYTYTYLGEAIDGEVEMTSSDSSVVVVEDGIIRAVGVGTANVLVKATSSHGEAAKNIKVTVTENQVEFYPSFLGKDVYVGNPLDLLMYVNENGTLKTIENVTFTVEDDSVATIEDGTLLPLTGGDTTITSKFEYNGESYEKVLPLHIYGMHTCSFMYLNGSAYYTVDAYYGDIIPLVLQDDPDNPEYNRKIKCWYVNGQEFNDEYFLMPDEDVEISVCFINETEDDDYYYAILDEINGSEAQAAAIGAYYHWSLGLSEEERASQIHQTHVAAIQALIQEFFTQTRINTNDPTVTDAHDAGNNHSGATDCHTAYNTAYETFHVVQFSNDSHDGKITLDKINYSTCYEASFGLFAISAGNGTITIGDQTFSFDSSKEHYFKVLIKDGVLTMTDDSQKNYDGGATVITATLSSDVLNGLAGLVIDCQFDAWSRVEITEMSITECKVIAVMKNIPTVDGGRYRGDQSFVGINNVHTAYKTTYENFYMTQFGTDPYDGTFTINKVNYSACSEVYFGLFAITSADGVITIGDQSFSFNNSKGHYFKIVIADGVLTMMDDSQASYDGGATIIKVALSEAVLSGTEALVIDFQFSGWSQAEITDMYFNLAVEDIV